MVFHNLYIPTNMFLNNERFFRNYFVLGLFWLYCYIWLYWLYCYIVTSGSSSIEIIMGTRNFVLFYFFVCDALRVTNVKNTHWEVLLICKSATMLKVTLLHGCFSRSFNCTNGTKSRKTSHIESFFYFRLKAQQECHIMS